MVQILRVYTSRLSQVGIASMSPVGWQVTATPLDVTYHSRWEIFGGQPRVVEHWTSDGEHFHFRYDFAQRISWATDVLGRELEVQFPVLRF